MTVRTRRTLIVCLVAIAVLAPAETILLRALSTPDAKTAARDWVGQLSSQELDQAAGEIQYYPLAYRKEIMRALRPAERSVVWRAHLENYLDARPDLDPNAVIAIEAAWGLFNPEALAGPTRSEQLQIAIVAQQLIDIIGRDETEYLLYRLGPADGTFASREPLTERLANYVRGLVVALAREGDCTCSTDFGCEGQATHCSDLIACTPDEEWPACGWGWYQTCDGICRPGMGM